MIGVVWDTFIAIHGIINEGDNFTNIASRHGVTVQAVIKANPAVDSNRMQIGQVLIIPSPEAKPPGPSVPEGTLVYEVKPGDSLYAIAKEHKTTVKAIRKANDLSTSKIRPRQKLSIPSPETEN